MTGDHCDRERRVMREVAMEEREGRERDSQKVSVLRPRQRQRTTREKPTAHCHHETTTAEEVRARKTGIVAAAAPASAAASAMPDTAVRGGRVDAERRRPQLDSAAAASTSPNLPRVSTRHSPRILRTCDCLALLDPVDGSWMLGVSCRVVADPEADNRQRTDERRQDGNAFGERRARAQSEGKGINETK